MSERWPVILSVPQLSGTVYCGLAIQANAALITASQADPDMPQVSWDDRAVVAVEEQQLAVGIITWTPVPWRKEASIKLGWVHLEHRRRGIYRLLWERLVEDAKREMLTTIRSAVKIDNHAMLATLQALGRQQEAVTTVFYL